MEFRRIQKTGRSTYIVSLPKAWVETKGLRKGEAVALQENEDGSLQLSVHSEQNFHAEIDATHLLALRKVVSAYIAGAQRILLKGKNAAAVAEQARQYLSAVEVIEEKKDLVVLRVFATGHEFSLETLLRRMHAIVLSLFDLAEKAFVEDVVETVERREKEMDRLYTLALRSMGSERGSSLFKFDALVAKALENIADELGQYSLEKPRSSKAVLASVRGVYEKAMRQFLEEKEELTVQKEIEALKEPLEVVRGKASLEWTRLMAIVKYCLEIEETTEDVLAIRRLSQEKD